MRSKVFVAFEESCKKSTFERNQPVQRVSFSRLPATDGSLYPYSNETIRARRGESDYHDRFFFGVLPTANFLVGTTNSILQETTLAGRGFYRTSQGTVREISTLKKLTRNARQYAQARGIMGAVNPLTYVAGAGLDAYAWWRGEVSGLQFAANTAVSSWVFGMGFVSGGALIAIPVGALYFGVDALYEDGWSEAFDEYDKRRTEVSRILNDPGYSEFNVGRPKF
jgi:hypothetical protein